MRTPTAGKDVEKLNHSGNVGGNISSTASMEDRLPVSWQKTTTKTHTTEYETAYDAAIAILGIYPREMKMYVHTKTYLQIFIAAY